MRGHILIADDHPIIRDALQAAVRSNWPHCIVDEAESLAQAEAFARSRTAYALLILDLMLPDANGFSGLLLLQKLLPETRIAMISARDDPQAPATANLLGAAAYILKSQPMSQIAEALRRVAGGERIFPPRGRPAARDASETRRRLDTLSPGQMRILVALADGRLNKQIAADMNVAEATVKAHLTAIFRKLGVTNRTQAILAAQPLFGVGR